MPEPNTCANCRWWHMDEIGTGWCCNSSSPYYADPTAPEATCREHEAKLESETHE